MQKLMFNTKIGNQMQNLYCRNVRNVKFLKIVAEKFAFYSKNKHNYITTNFVFVLFRQITTGQRREFFFGLFLKTSFMN